MERPSLSEKNRDYINSLSKDEVCELWSFFSAGYVTEDLLAKFLLAGSVAGVLSFIGIVILIVAK